MAVVDKDRDVVWMSELLNSVTPTHWDGNILVEQILKEQQEQLTNGIWSIFQVPRGKQ